MPLKPCLRCGALSPGSYCPEHEPKAHKVRPSQSSLNRPSPALRRRIKQRDGNRCRVCGSTESLRVHHVRGVAGGGSHGERNLVTLCDTCHRTMHRRRAV